MDKSRKKGIEAKEKKTQKLVNYKNLESEKILHFYFR